MKLLLQSLDSYGCGFFSIDDLEWLDGWEPAQWLTPFPDEDAWAEIKALLLKKSGHLLQGWFFLDRNGSNNVSWKEFSEACEQLRYTGNVGGAWRALDPNMSGLVSFKQVDPENHELLVSFKEWADQYYGSVEAFFAECDADKNGFLTFSEIKKACQQLQWNGRVRSLFDCLGLDRRGLKSGCRRAVSVHELAFLDSWLDSQGPKDQGDQADADSVPAPSKMKRSVSTTGCLNRHGVSHVSNASSPATTAPTRTPVSSWKKSKTCSERKAKTLRDKEVDSADPVRCLWPESQPACPLPRLKESPYVAPWPGSTLQPGTFGSTLPQQRSLGTTPPRVAPKGQSSGGLHRTLSEPALHQLSRRSPAIQVLQASPEDKPRRRMPSCASRTPHKFGDLNRSHH